MKISYDHWHQLWYPTDTTERLSFGANQIPLPSFTGKTLFSIDLKNVNGNLGPLIGIMASLSKNGAILGNIPLFKSVQREAISKGGICIVFAPEEIKNNQISGFLYLPEQDAWYQVVSPLPHVVYNRVPLRKTEESPSFDQARRLFEEWNIPFFNPFFIDKAKLYELVKEDSILEPLMPKSILISEETVLAEFLRKHQGVYLKPSLSSRGKGIFLLHTQKDGSIALMDHKQKNFYPSFNAFWKETHALLRKKRYIAQVEISPAQLDGKRFDFRIHAHDSPEGYKVTGVGVRQSHRQSLTTHVPNGGVLVPYERVRTEQHDLFFSKLVKRIGALLTKKLGYFGEFSIDAGLTQSGEYVLFEVNSKPMAFDEQKIEKERIQRIVELLFYKANF
ncbi:YheC/YheD family protein [Mesobacillus maritimus]|uniref:YheC/YheD family endospore coat-associated protein n=1 Tax=Mesobacillus maritimus TaxID=1643336 RepID=UPI00203CFA67|nr:YheC/YheD family protein [Mesobacillus maritimus]MCM3586041.1 YheC/YheD family protein [Mesobacillus maritimus]MCM3671727.1 YheC/YheD family protein [Mesobacillus maritimus]